MTIEKGQVLIDIKCEGGIVIVPPTIVDETLVFAIDENNTTATITIPGNETRREIVITMKGVAE